MLEQARRDGDDELHPAAPAGELPAYLRDRLALGPHARGALRPVPRSGRVLAAGIDTLSPCWYAEPGSPLARAIAALATQQAHRAWLLPDPVGGYRVGWFDQPGLVFAEGRPGGEALCAAAELPLALRWLRRDLEDLGIPVATTDETAPPQLRKLTIEINRHGRLDSTGLPACKVGLIRTASNGRALGACGPALVGEGKFFGTITLPGGAPYPIEGKLLVFNGREHGKPVLYGHVFSPHPFATSFVIAFQISHDAKGPYGTILSADLAKALGTQRNLTGIEMTLSRRYSYKGRQRSYASAGCPAPKGFPGATFPFAKASFAFGREGTLTSVLNRSCVARG